MPLDDPTRAAPVPEAVTTAQPESGLLAAGGALAPFRYPAFRAIWIANLASNVGSMIQAVGAAWLMTELTPQHRLIALVQASNTVPVMLLGLFAGAIADNYDRRRVMIAAQTMMLIVSAILAVLAWQGLVGPYLLLAMTFAVGMGTALNGPAWQASVRLQVGHRDLPQAISLNAIAFNLARSVGPALGGLIISIWNPSLAFGLNAISYVGMVVVLLRWHPETIRPTPQPMLRSIMVGVNFCARSGPIRRVLLRGAAFGVGAIACQALMPGIARDQLHSSAVGYGVMLGAFGIGSITTALFIGALRRRHGAEWVVTLATTAFLSGQLLLAEAHSLALAIPAMFLAGGGFVATMTSLNVAVQLRAPEAILGRCLSLYQAIVFGAMAVGAYGWGAIADRFGLVVAIRMGAGWLALTLLLRFVIPMPRREEGRVDPTFKPQQADPAEDSHAAA
jgi:MFS family permease